MGEFQITQIVNNTTFKVHPGWRYKNATGQYIQISHPFYGKNLSAVQTVPVRSLSQKLFGRVVKLGQVQRIKNGKLVCEVFCESKNIKRAG